MSDRSVYRWSGIFGLAAGVCVLLELPLWLASNVAPPLADPAHADYLATHRTLVLTRVLLDLGVYVGVMVFFAGFRELVRRTHAGFNWLGTLAYGAGLVWFAVTLVADSLEGAAALDALGGSDPSAVRALVEGALLIHDGSIALALTALFLGAAACAIQATGVLPRWVAAIGWAGTALCVASIPAMFVGEIDARGFYNVAGWGPAIATNLPPLVFLFAASVTMLRGGQAPRRERRQRGVRPVTHAHAAAR